MAKHRPGSAGPSKAKASTTPVSPQRRSQHTAPAGGASPGSGSGVDQRVPGARKA